MHSGRELNHRHTGFARRLRHHQTEAERKLWSQIRNGQIGGFKFRRQVPVGGFIVDFYCIEARLVVELDGGQHFEGDAIQYDQKRTEKLAELKITVVRFSNFEMLKFPDAVARTIYGHLQTGAVRALQAGPSPQPSPGVPGEGVRNEK